MTCKGWDVAKFSRGDRQYLLRVALETLDVRLRVIEIVAAERTAARIRTLEPPEQARRVEVVLARPALFVRRLHVRPDNAVADGTFTLSLQCTLNVALEGHETFDQTARGEDDDLEGA